LNEGKVQYFYVRFSQGANLYKYVFVAYVGEGASGMLRGNSQNHTIDFGNFLKTLRAPIHVQVNARSESDLDEAAIQKQLRGAMGSNYDAGAKNQGVTGGVKTVGEGVRLHKEAQEESAKISYDKRALPFIPDASTREQFWNKHNEDAARNKGKANQPVIDDQERKNFWEKQQKEAAQKAAQAQNTPVVASGASNLRAQFEQKATEQVAPPVQSGGKKWTPPPATSKPPPSAAPPVTSKPPTSGPPPVASAPPPVTSKPPPVSAPPPSYSAAPPPVPSGGPPVPSGGPPVHTPEIPPQSFSFEAEAEDTWAEPEPPVPPTSASAPPSAEEIMTVTALYPFEAEQASDLSFNEGDTIWVLDKTDPSGWWKGRDAYGNEGYFPMNFIIQ